MAFSLGFESRMRIDNRALIAEKQTVPSTLVTTLFLIPSARRAVKPRRQHEIQAGSIYEYIKA